MQQQHERADGQRDDHRHDFELRDAYVAYLASGSSLDFEEWAARNGRTSGGLRESMIGRLVTSLTALALVATPLAAQDVTCVETGDKSPTTARVVGIVPGAGHVYACEFLRGLGYFVGTLSIVGAGAAASALECLDLSGDGCGRSAEVALVAAAGLWAWSIYDAGRAARRTNARRRSRVSVTLTPGWLVPEGRTGGPALTVGLTLKLPQGPTGSREASTRD